MPDISKCSNAEEINCPLRFECYRFTSKPNAQNQSWARFDYYANSCNGFWKEESSMDVAERKIEEARERLKEFF